MGTKLSRVLDEITRTEEKIAVWQAHLEELNIRRKQLEDAQIVKSVRAMKLEGREMLAFLENLQNGTVSAWKEPCGMDMGQAEDWPEHAGSYEKAETGSGETENNIGPEERPAEREDREDEK